MRARGPSRPPRGGREARAGSRGAGGGGGSRGCPRCCGCLAWSTVNKPSKSYIAFCSYALVCYTTATRPGAAGCSPLLSVAVSTASGDSGGGALSSAALQVMLVPRMIVEQLSNVRSVSATALRSYKHHLILPGNRYGWRVRGYQALMGAQLRLLTLRTTRRG